MRKTLMSLTALAALAGAGLVSEAKAAPVMTPTAIEGASVQTVQYYYYGRPYYGRPVYWHHYHHWRHWHRWHRWHHRW